MDDNFNRVEAHGCIVCGKIHQLLVVYSPAEIMVAVTVISPDGQVVPDKDLPLAACSTHTGDEIERALSSHYPGMEQPEDTEE